MMIQGYIDGLDNMHTDDESIKKEVEDYYPEGTLYKGGDNPQDEVAELQEALTALAGVPLPERDGRWYYLSAVANMYQGSKIAALNDAKRAVEIDPDNEEYRRLVQQLQSGGDYYTNYTRTYHSGLSADRLCLAMCAANMCLGPMCGYRVWCC